MENYIKNNILNYWFKISILLGSSREINSNDNLDLSYIEISFCGTFLIDKTQKWKNLFLFLILLLKNLNKVKYIIPILSIFLLLCANCKHENAKDQTPVDKLQSVPNRNPVKIIVLKPSTFQKELISNGKLVALHKSVLKFKAGEELAILNMNNGDRVEKGQVIAKLDQEKFLQTLQQAELQLAKAELELRDILIGQGYQWEDSTRIPSGILEMARLRSGYTSALYNKQNANTDLQNTVLRAPFTGIVANISHKIYEQVNTSSEFCTLIDNSAYEVEFEVLETEISEISLNKTVKVIPFVHEDEVYQGFINEINPVVDENGLIRIKALVKNTQGLMEGMNVKVKTETAVPDMLVVPKSAVVLRQNQEVLFKYTHGKAFWTYVQTGYENSTSYTVNAHPDKGGSLAAGDTVIISGNLNLAHESEVVIE